MEHPSNSTFRRRRLMSRHLVLTVCLTITNACGLLGAGIVGAPSRDAGRRNSRSKADYTCLVDYGQAEPAGPDPPAGGGLYLRARNSDPADPADASNKVVIFHDG